jgi:hypothetical protein
MDGTTTYLCIAIIAVLVLVLAYMYYKQREGHSAGKTMHFTSEGMTGCSGCTTCA